MMGRPAGSKNKPKELSSASINNDGYAEAFTGTGTNRDRSSYTRIKPTAPMQQQECSMLYLGDGFARKIVDVPAEEMTRSGIRLEDLEDDDLEGFVNARLDDLDAMRHFNDAVAWSRLHGGALMVFGLNDGGMLDTPLTPTNIASVEFLRVYDRWQATVQTRVTDPMSADYGKPDIWLVSPVDGAQPYKVHNSRVWRFDGDRIPDQERTANLGWGVSALQACRDQLTRFGASHQHTAMILERAQQAIHKIPGMAELLKNPIGEAQIKKRVDIVDMVRGILNTIVIDEKEGYDVITATLTGYSDILDRFAEALAGTSGIPVFKLMERTQGGLSNTDKGASDAWYARVEAWWNNTLRKPQDMLIQYLMISKVGEAPDYKLCMKPLSVLSATEQADVDLKNAQARKARSEAEVNLCTANILDPLEVRQTYAEDYDLFSAEPDNDPQPGAGDGV